MVVTPGYQNILLIKPSFQEGDNTASWLREDGFSVQQIDNYQDWENSQKRLDKTSALVILSCGKLGLKEEELIKSIKASGYVLLVLCNFLSATEARQIFRLGADDVADKPYTAINLQEIVHQTLSGIAQRNSLRIEN
jgi:DNA-binding response OmpR family regulator